MKTKIIALFAILALAFVGLNTTSCSKDDDNSSSTSDSYSCSKEEHDSIIAASDSYSCSKEEHDSIIAAADSFSLGISDGGVFASAVIYEVKDYTFVADSYAITTMLEYGTKYRNSNDKAYKKGFSTEVTIATGLTESQLTNLLGSESEAALLTLLKTYFD